MIVSLTGIVVVIVFLLLLVRAPQVVGIIVVVGLGMAVLTFLWKLLY